MGKQILFFRSATWTNPDVICIPHLFKFIDLAFIKSKEENDGYL